ncbi:MAG TPA: hypothetical protein VIJ94_02790 [Caulobacteraceae bacterium]
MFGILEKAAASGARCPGNEAIAGMLQAEGVMISLGTVPGVISRLAREGRIEVRLYGHLWREVVIRAGRQVGRSTEAPPSGAKPWRVIGG